MPDLNYSVDLSSARSGQLQLLYIHEELEGTEDQSIRFVEREHVAALNFGKIFFGTGNISVRGRKKNIS